MFLILTMWKQRGMIKNLIGTSTYFSFTILRFLHKYYYLEHELCNIPTVSESTKHAVS